MIAKNIKWDTDGNSELLDILPKEVVIPNSITDEDEISDWLSDEYSFCHLGFDIASDFTNWLIETGYLDPEDIYDVMEIIQDLDKVKKLLQNSITYSCACAIVRKEFKKNNNYIKKDF